MILKKVRCSGQVIAFFWLGAQKQQKGTADFSLFENVSKSSFCLLILDTIAATSAVGKVNFQEKNLISLLLELLTTYQFNPLIPPLPISSVFLLLYFLNSQSLLSLSYQFYVIYSPRSYLLILFQVFFHPLYFFSN